MVREKRKKVSIGCHGRRLFSDFKTDALFADVWAAAMGVLISVSRPHIFSMLRSRSSFSGLTCAVGLALGSLLTSHRAPAQSQADINGFYRFQAPAGVSGGFGTDATRWDYAGSNGGVQYGNPSLLPLIGGSGGAGNGGWDDWGRSGGAGGGAMLIACTNHISFDLSRLVSNGGDGDWERNGVGSGGGIRLICANLVGSGELSAGGGTNTGSIVGSGRIRLERIANDNTLNTTPAPSVVDLQDGSSVNS